MINHLFEFVVYFMLTHRSQIYLLLSANGIIRSQSVEDVMLKVDRGKYAKFNPYMDAPQGIGYGVTISAPHMVLYRI
jgi:protein-L-isoaspartate(D-aspartate) O-methyltransferase